MKCILLAAGYATRLYPLTKNFPKPLLKVKDKTIIDWLIEDLVQIEVLTEVIIVSNHKFMEHFEKWKEESQYKVKITILDDGSVDNETRLGAVKDVLFALDACNVQEDFMVLAGDNLTDFSLKGFYEFFIDKNKTCIMRHFEESVDKLRRTGVITIDENAQVLEMQEKPSEPASNWAVPPFYIYKADARRLFTDAIASHQCNVDAPGDFIAWLCKKQSVYAYEMPGKRYDVGNLESYKKICEDYRGIK